jgi:hypothetical protein
MHFHVLNLIAVVYHLRMKTVRVTHITDKY